MVSYRCFWMQLSGQKPINRLDPHGIRELPNAAMLVEDKSGSATRF
jgi:hypothetical protein